VLCGHYRAQERLYLTHACERRLWGSREPAIRSQFLTEIPEELLTSKSLQIVFLAISWHFTKGSRGSQDATDRVLTSQSQNWVIAFSIKPLVSVNTHISAQEQNLFSD